MVDDGGLVLGRARVVRELLVEERGVAGGADVLGERPQEEQIQIARFDVDAERGIETAVPLERVGEARVRGEREPHEKRDRPASRDRR